MQSQNSRNLRNDSRPLMRTRWVSVIFTHLPRSFLSFLANRLPCNREFVEGFAQASQDGTG
jgi:hypothetical protein